MVLRPLFDGAFSPNQFGMYKLEEATIQWLKGMVTVLPEQREHVPETVALALESLKKFQDSTDELEKVKAKAKQVNSAAAAAAETRFQSMVSDLVNASTSMSDAEAILQGKKKLLEKWVSDRYNKGQEEIDICEGQHFDTRAHFEKMVHSLVHVSYDEFLQEPNQSAVLAQSCPEDDDFLRELDQALESSLVAKVEDHMKNSEAPPVQPPKESVTSSFEEMKKAIEVVANNSKLPDQVRDAVVGSLQECVTNALEGKPVGEKEPEVPEEPPKPPAASTVKAIELELQRRDTTQLSRGNTNDLENEELAKAAVEQPDGSFLYKNSKGKLETLEERQKRLAHNSYVAFSRSFDGILGCT